MFESACAQELRERRKRELASSFATEIAEQMVGTPERMVRSVMAGRDCDGKLFISFTPPFPDYDAFTDDERSRMHTEWRRVCYREFTLRVYFLSKHGHY